MQVARPAGGAAQKDELSAARSILSPAYRANSLLQCYQQCDDTVRYGGWARTPTISRIGRSHSMSSARRIRRAAGIGLIVASIGTAGAAWGQLPQAVPLISSVTGAIQAGGAATAAGARG